MNPIEEEAAQQRQKKLQLQHRTFPVTKHLNIESNKVEDSLEEKMRNGTDEGNVSDSQDIRLSHANNNTSVVSGAPTGSPADISSENLVPCFTVKPRTSNGMGQHKKKPVWEMTREEQANPPGGILFDEEDLLEFAEGDIAKVFGPQFSVIDTYPCRVRLPQREYLLVSRVTKMNAGVNEFVSGASMTTEYDLPVNCELSEGGDVPWAVLVESGQCDLMLISYMGIDFQCKGERMYRLLDTTLTFYGVATEGQTLTYDIQVNSFARGSHGGISMFFFSYNCYCDGKLLIEMRNGAAGFFTNEELAAGKGIIKTRAELMMRSKIKKRDISKFIVAQPSKTAFSPEDMQKLVKGKWESVMDDKGGRKGFHYKLCARKMLMIDNIPEIDPHGGVHGLGLVLGEKFLERDHWYFPCHFKGDQVMAGSLVSDGCSQLLKLYMIYLGLHSKVDNPRFLPIPGNPNKVRCRGQISPHKGKLVYVMEIRDIGFEKETGYPYAIADVDIIDVNFEQGQTFNRDRLDEYGKGDMNKKIVVDFKGIALRIEGTTPSSSSSSSSATEDLPGNDGISETALHPYPPQPPIEGALETDASPPSKVTWHPLAGSQNGAAPTPSFSPSRFPPRNIAFTPFAGNPNDTEHTPGKLPLSWYNMCEFMCGKVSECLGPEFSRFDDSRTSRSPAFDLQMVTRVIEVTNLERKQVLNIDLNPSKGEMVAEFDCPSNAWFFKGSCNDMHMPYSIMMEIGLQTSGILTSWVKAPLTMDQDNILFRNLDATAELVKVVDLRNKTITNRSRVKNYSMLGSMGIHTFYFELLADGEVFYKGDTSFGWFIPEVFEKQMGLDNGKKRDPWHVTEKGSANAKQEGTVYQLSPGHADRAKLFANSARPNVDQLHRRSSQCEFLDSVRIIPDSGQFGKGYAHGHKQVDLNDWFFSCHFWMDPVMPGSLGIESMIQAAEAWAIHENIAAKYGIREPTFTHAPGKTSWKYRGQLTPKNSHMDCEAHIKSVTQTTNAAAGGAAGGGGAGGADGSRGAAVDIVIDGFLYVDKLRVYSATDLRLRVVDRSTLPFAKHVDQVQSAGSTSRSSLQSPSPSPSPSPPSGQQPNSLQSTQQSEIGSMQALQKRLLKLDQPLFLRQDRTTGKLFECASGSKHHDPTVAEIFACTPRDLGDRSFMETYGVQYPMYTGAMAKGVASADLVIAAGKRGILASLGAGGLPMHLVKAALDKIQAALPHGPYAVNLIHSPFNEELERGNVDLFLERGVRTVEASAFMNLTPQVVRYRVCGLTRGDPSKGQPPVVVNNRVIAKVSRTELAEMFLRPAPEAILKKLLNAGSITEEQAQLAQSVPMCDDIAVEADSGGHTDNRPIHVILPLIISVRNRVHRECGYDRALRVRVGAGGGIGCPAAASAAFNMGAAFVVTGTINQMTRQSGSSDIVRSQLAAATYSDIAMAPAADMFDQGVELQVLKKGTMFPSRAKKLYDLFVTYASLEDIPAEELQRLEKRVFRKQLDVVWRETRDFYINVLHNQEKVDHAETDGKLKMSLVFRWYLGQSSSWANNGVGDRSMDYQVWCGPAIGAFNDFISGSYLDPKVSGEYPCVAQVSMQIMMGTAYLRRVYNIKRHSHLDVDADDPALATYSPMEAL